MFACCNQPAVDKSKELDRIGASPVMKKEEPAPIVEVPAQEPPKPVEEAPKVVAEAPKVVEALKEEPKKEEPAKEEPKPVEAEKKEPEAPTAPTSGTFEVTIDRSSKGSKLGMTIGRVDKALKIKSFETGDVSTFNTKNPGMALKAMDLVVAVNGKEGSANDLLKALSSPDALTLKIKRS